MKFFFRFVACAYAAIVGLAAVWAWYGDIRMLHSTQEHLLPDILLALVSMPTSQLVGVLYDMWPNFFSAPFVQLTALTICGAIQVAALFGVSAFLSKPQREA